MEACARIPQPQFSTTGNARSPNPGKLSFRINYWLLSGLGFFRRAINLTGLQILVLFPAPEPKSLLCDEFIIVRLQLFLELVSDCRYLLAMIGSLALRFVSLT